MKIKIHPTEHQYLLAIKSLRNWKKKTKLLEIGAGSRTLKKFLPEQFEYYSLDFDSEDKNAFFKVKHDYTFDLDKGKMPIESNSYDVVVCLETLEHVMYPNSVLKEIKRIVKPNGLLFLSMPNEYNFLQRIYFLLGRKGKMDEPFEIIEKHLHIHKPRKKDILDIFSKHFKILEVDYMWQSRSSMNSSLARTIDSFFRKLAKIYPSLFARMVIVKAENYKD